MDWSCSFAASTGTKSTYLKAGFTLRCYSVEVKLRVAALVLTSVSLVAGCRSSHAPLTAQERADQAALLESQREQIAMIPPPSKSRYMAVHSLDGWENPYVTVQSDMVGLHITLADANPTTLGVGSMLRPVGARRQELNVGMDKLGEAISSIPQSAWPYGRVVAIEEAHKVPPNAEPAVRRNMETTIRRLSDLGVVVYDVNEGKLQ